MPAHVEQRDAIAAEDVAARFPQDGHGLPGVAVTVSIEAYIPSSVLPLEGSAFSLIA